MARTYKSPHILLSENSVDTTKFPWPEAGRINGVPLYMEYILYHQGLGDVTIRLVDKCSNELTLREREAQWAYRLKTIFPLGLNSDVLFFAAGILEGTCFKLLSYNYFACFYCTAKSAHIVNF